MESNATGVRKLLPGVFGIALICFFLPFISVSCQNDQKVASFTGMQLVVGTTIEEPAMFGQKSTRHKLNGEPLAILAFIGVVVGFGLSFVKNRGLSLGPLIAALVSLLLLLSSKARIESEILRQTSGLLQVQSEMGLWLVSLSLIAAGVFSTTLLVRKNEMYSVGLGRSINQMPTYTRSRHGEALFCSECGERLDRTDQFCSQCGKALV